MVNRHRCTLCTTPARARIASADRQKGRFRDYLKTLARHFLSDRVGKKAKRQVLFERRFVSIQTLLSDEERTYQPASGESAEEVFDRQWAMESCRTVLEQLRQHYAGEDREVWVEIFLAYCAPEEKRPSQEALGERFDLTRDAVRSVLRKVEQRYRRLLSAELREEGVDEGQIDEEIQRLIGILVG